MPDQKIFCNTPWYEIHIYWDGSLGVCCQEDRKLYNEGDTRYNIKNMTLMEWFNSRPVREFRTSMSGDRMLPECRRCYLEEEHNGNSRRLKSNLKSVIFTRTAFHDSYLQSPGHHHFEYSRYHAGHTGSYPIDLHVDLGNFCNLACKMCNPMASSTIASQHVKWGIESDRQYLGQDWTRDPEVWESFKKQILEIPKLNNIHFMGGETLLTDRFENLVDTMIDNQRFDLCFSFVTNGTTFRPALLDKLRRFRRVGIEISIESITKHNDYTRQGTDTREVIKNIERYQQWCNGTSITVALRPAPSILTIGNFVTLLEYALEHRLVVKSNLCYEPKFLDARILPDTIKTIYRQKYIEFINQMDDVKVDVDYNASDPNRYREVIREQANLCIGLLDSEQPPNSTSLLSDMVQHCKRWDIVYGMDARQLYPEFRKILDEHGY